VSGRRSWERLAALAGVVFAVCFVAAFSLGIEVGPSDREILEHYADSDARAKEIVAFFLIAAAALALLVFAAALRSLIASAEQERGTLAALAGLGGVAYTALTLAGNAVSRAAAFASTDTDFKLDPNTRRYFEDAGLLLLASGAIAAMVLVVGASLAALRYGVLPRWAAWIGFPLAALFPLAVAFVGFLALLAWVLIVSGALALGARGVRAEHP
jgi:hypothetical protein